MHGSSVATYPLAAYIIAAASSVVPGAALMARIGRRPVFLGSAALAALGAGLVLLSAYQSLYWLLVVGSFLQGPGFAQANNFRFVAAEFAEPHFRPRAISLVVLGGVLAAAVGPETARHARYMLPVEFAGCYVVLCVLYGLLLLLLLLLDYSLLQRLSSQLGAAATPAAAAPAPQPAHPPDAPAPAPAACVAVAGEVPAPARGALQQANGGNEAGACKDASSIDATSKDVEGGSAAAAPQPLGRSPSASVNSSGGAEARAAGPPAPPPPPPPPLLTWRELLLTWRFMLPAAGCALSFCGMAALMSMTPLVVQRSIGYNQSVFVVEAHIVAMYLPGLVTADIVRVAGAPATLSAGAAVLLCGTATFYGPVAEVSTFFVGMILIGVGWNWAYTAASVLVVQVYEREPRRRFGVQGATDTCVLVATGVCVGTASTLAVAMGWSPGFVSLYMGVSGVLAAVAAACWLMTAAAARRACSGKDDPA